MSSLKKTGNKDATGIVFDTQTKIVLTSLPRGNQNKIKEKISSVREVVPHRSNNEITLVLEHFEYNVEDTIAAFLEDGAASVLKEWNCSGCNKSIKKGKKKPPQSNASNSTVKNSAKFQTNNVGKKDHISSQEPVNGILKDLISVKEVALSNSTVSDSLSGGSSRHNSVSECRDSRQKSGKKSLEKPVKDLNRHSVSLLRIQHLLSEEFRASEKRLKESFLDLHKILTDREAELANKLNEVKGQTSSLLEGRISQANKLKMNVGRADSMNNAETNELCIDLKHFISERKYDEELSRTVRFMRDHDRLVNEIKGYGEVIPVKNLYTRRRQSVSSIKSEPISTIANTPPNVVEKNPVLVSKTVEPCPTSPAMTAAEVTILRQKLQESLRSQGLCVDTAASNRTVRTTNGTTSSAVDNKRSSNATNSRQNTNSNKPRTSEASSRAKNKC